MAELLKKIGLLDRNGTEIHVGDIVEFHFDPDRGYADIATDGYTCMRDIVIEKESKFYFMCGAGGALAWRHNRNCVVIGRDESLVDTKHVLTKHVPTKHIISIKDRTEWRYPERDSEVPTEYSEIIHIVKYDHNRKKKIGTYELGRIDDGYTLKDLACWMYAPKDPIID